MSSTDAPTATGTVMGAVVVVRAGVLPAGAAETVAECGGVVLLVGEGVREAAAGLAAGPDRSPSAAAVRGVELGPFAPGSWAGVLAPVIEAWDVVVLPGSPDGRDLAPRLAHRLGRPLLAGAISVTPEVVTVGRLDARQTQTHHHPGRFVATLLPGARGGEAEVADGSADTDTDTATGGRRGASIEMIEIAAFLAPDGGDAQIVSVSDPDPATMDLSDAPRVVVGGAGLGHPDQFEVLAQVAAGLGASPGATRVVADAGWVPARRYIGTTGVSIHPELYVAFGVSGAVQHTTGIGHPDHIIAVNTDPSAPMMALADLAVVADAPAVMAALVDHLDQSHPSGPTSGELS